MSPQTLCRKPFMPPNGITEVVLPSRNIDQAKGDE
jgi:hypothetical protein